MNDRSEKISKLFSSQKYRVGYILGKLSVLVPAQIRSLRINSTNPSMPYQRDLARETELHQSRISMFETPGMSNMTLETLAKVAAGLRSGLVVKFVPFSEMLRWENDFSPNNFDVIRLDQDIDFINPVAASSSAEEREQTTSPYAMVANQEQAPNPIWVDYLGASERRPVQRVTAIAPIRPPEHRAALQAAGR